MLSSFVTYLQFTWLPLTPPFIASTSLYCFLSQLMEEIDDSVKTAVWVGDCFVYTSNGQWVPSYCGKRAPPNVLPSPIFYH